MFCGLYVHIPFCETKCGYCDFFSVPLEGRVTGPLVTGILAELRLRANLVPKMVRTIFVGGGTPTVLPTTELRRLFGALGAIADSHGVEEFTVEANPATLDDEKLSILTSAGVDRISMGAQSWHGRELATLERLHSPGDIGPSVALARKYGLNKINLDLIFGIPEQTQASWADSLRRTIDLGVDHISCYGLTYEPATRLTAQLGAGRIRRCDEDLEAEMYLQAIDTLAEAGYEQYEISNFALAGRRCRHNMIYWRHEPYVGVGPSAAGFIDGQRYKNVADIASYIRDMEERGHAVSESERIAGAMLAGEMVLMQLRLNDGLDVGRFIERTGIDPHLALATSLARFMEAGLVCDSGDSLALTRKGRLVADTIISEFYTELHNADDR